MRNKKALAAKVLDISPKKVHFSPEALGEIQKAITRSDLRGLIAMGKISLKRVPQQSRARARSIARQKRKGRQKGKGSRKGTPFARVSRKRRWITRVRVQRSFLQLLRNHHIVSTANYHRLYTLCKGGYFRNRRHIKLYLTEHQLTEKNNSGKVSGSASENSSRKEVSS